jgi:uncharacterized protein DUF6262
MNTATVSEPRTAAAQAARRHKTETALKRVHRAIARLLREKAQIGVAAVTRRADVSRTFLYDDPEARAVVAAAMTEAGERPTQMLADQDNEHESTWRERALNAEEGLKTAQHEILVQRSRIGALIGQTRLAGRVERGSHPADHYREHHAQAARPPAHHRQPHPRRATQGRPLEPSLPGPARR